MKIKAKLGLTLLIVSLFLITANAFAASHSFSAILPAYQGDVEVSTVARSNSSNSVKYFSIKLTSIDQGYTHVRAWTEKTLGANLSDPYNQVRADNSWWTVNYYADKEPSKGDNVTLNLDNPVYTSATVNVAGEWTPNQAKPDSLLH